MAAFFLVYVGNQLIVYQYLFCKINLLSLRQRLELGEVGAEESSQFGRLFRHLHLTHFQFVQVEDVIDELPQLFPALSGYLQQLGLFVGQLVFVQEAANGAEQQREWGAQFVRDIGKKAGFSRVEGFQLFRLLMDEGVLFGEFSLVRSQFSVGHKNTGSQQQDQERDEERVAELGVFQVQFQLSFFVFRFEEIILRVVAR